MKITLITFLFLSFSVNAEYRVYQYLVTNKVNNSYEQPNSSIKVSTLNPSAYMAYYGGSSLVEIDLLRTWRCIGDTSKKELCPSPYQKLEQQEKTL